MKILLVGNYPFQQSQSMDRFARFLATGLKEAGHSVRLVKPPPVLGCILPSSTGVGKWLGYFDRFILFPPILLSAARWADVVHICDHANSVYVPWLKDKPHVLTCHDMLAIRCALGEIDEQETGLAGRFYQRWILTSLKKANRVVCVSNATCDDLLRLSGLSSDRATVIPNGLNFPYRPMKKRQYLKHLEKLGFSKSRPFFLHVGNNNWYKNKPGLLRIFKHMVRLDDERTFNLVLAGAPVSENLSQIARDLGIYDRIRLAINITNQQLCALYSSAEGLIFPSLSEGFGWPVVEAQACGCPVFASNRKSLTEIIGTGGEYFDPSDENQAAHIILQAAQYKDRLKEKGYKNAMRFSSKNMIDGYIQIYNSCFA